MSGRGITGNIQKGIQLKLFIKYLLIINAFIACAWAQDSDYLITPESGMESAAKSYNDERYTEAYGKFEALAQKYPQDIRASSFRFMAAKSLYKSGDYESVIPLWRDFLRDFPGSRLRDEAKLLLGHSLFRIGQLYEAASEYLSAIESDPESDIGSSAKENVMPLINRGLTGSELRRLLTEYPASPVAEQIEFTLAKKEIDRGRYRKGIKALQAFMRDYPGSKEFKQAKTLMEQAALKLEEEVEIGLLVPVSGNYQDYGRYMIEGATLALKEVSDKSVKINLSIKDTQGNPITAANMAGAISDEEPVAVVGALRSESTISAAILLNERGIPIIAPTASENGIPRIGPNVFQIPSPIEDIGRAIAGYAFGALGIKDFAIIAPDDAGGTRIANAFSQTIYELGGDVVLTSYYPAGTTDFKSQIGPLRDILLIETENRLASGALDTSEFWDHKKDKILEKEDWPVELGGLFLPGYPDDLKLLIPQVKYHVIRTQFLGADGWDSAELLREVSAYVKGAIFATDFHTRSDDPRWAQFAKSYSEAYGHAPNRVAAMTYDAVCLIIDGILNGNRSPENMRQYLNRISDFPGVSGSITFEGSGRANKGVAIYSIDGRRLTAGK